MISDFLVKDDDFAAVLNDHMKTKEPRDIAVAVAKIIAFGELKEDIQRQKKHAEATAEDLQSPLDTLENALGRVGGERISYDSDALAEKVNGAVAASRQTIRETQAAVSAVDTYTPAPGVTFFDMKRELRALGERSDCRGPACGDARWFLSC